MKAISMKTVFLNVLIIVLLIYTIFIGVKCLALPQVIVNQADTETQELIISEEAMNYKDKIGMCFTSPKTAKKYLDAVFLEKLNRDKKQVDYLKGAEVIDFRFIESSNEWSVKYRNIYNSPGVLDGGPVTFNLKGENGMIEQ